MEQQDDRLNAFLDASLQLTENLDAEHVMNVIVERSMAATGAQYGAVASLDRTGAIDGFVHRGLTEDEVAVLPHLPEGKGVLGAVIEERRTIRLDRLADHASSVGFPDRHVAMEAFLGVPLLIRGRLVGALYLTKAPGETPFTDQDVGFITAMGAMAATGLTNSRLFEAESRRAEQGALLQKIAWAVRHSLEVTDVLEDAVEAVGEAAGVDRCFIRLIEEETGQLGPVEVEWDAPEVPQLEPDRMNQYPVGSLALVSRLTQWTEDMHSDPRFAGGYEEALATARRAKTVGALATPLEWGDELLGVLTFHSVTPRRWSSNDIDLIEGAAREVSIALHHARLYYEALDTAEKLKILDGMRSDFLSMVSHELRSPMTVVSGIAHILRWKGEKLPETARAELLDTLERESRRLSRLVSEFLDLEAIDRGKIELRSDAVDLSELAAEAMVDAGYAARTNIEVGTGDTTVKADRDRIKQVLLNLIGNAAKFSPEKEVIDIHIEPRDDHVMVAVRDHGPGISEEDKERLFARFSRLSTTVKQTSGSGIGLYVSKTMVELHGGEIWVESVVGDGATFAFTLPR